MSRPVAPSWASSSRLISLFLTAGGVLTAGWINNSMPSWRAAVSGMIVGAVRLLDRHSRPQLLQLHRPTHHHDHRTCHLQYHPPPPPTSRSMASSALTQSGETAEQSNPASIRVGSVKMNRPRASRPGQQPTPRGKPHGDCRPRRRCGAAAINWGRTAHDRREGRPVITWPVQNRHSMKTRSV